MHTWLLRRGSARSERAPGAPDVQVAVRPFPERLWRRQRRPALGVPPVVESEPDHRLDVPDLHAGHAEYPLPQTGSLQSPLKITVPAQQRA